MSLNGRAVGSHMTTDPGVRKLPILPLRNSVLLPGSAMPSRVSRVQSIALIESAVAGGLMVGVIAQREPTVDDPGQADLYQVGTVANLSRLPGDSPDEPCVLLRGISRFRIVEVVQTTPYLWAYVEDLPEQDGDEQEHETLFARLQALAQTVIRQMVPEPQAAIEMIASMDNLADLAALMCANLDVPTVEKQRVLETSSIVQRAQLVIGLLERMRTGVTPTAQQAPTSYFVTKPLSRAAFLAKAAELGWIFADRTPSTVESPEVLTFRAGEELVRYQQEPFLDLSLLLVASTTAGDAQVVATELPVLCAEQIIQGLPFETDPADRLSQLAILFGLHATRSDRLTLDGLHAQLRQLLGRADAEACFFASMAMSALGTCEACHGMLAEQIVRVPEPRFCDFTSSWMQRRAAPRITEWFARFRSLSPSTRVWRVPEQTTHREVLRALWAAGYVPIEFRSHELSGLPFREQHWFSPDGACRVLYQFTLESPIPVRLIQAEGHGPERVRHDLAQAGCGLLGIDDLVARLASLTSGAQVIEAVAQIMQTALPEDADRVVAALAPLCTHPDPRVLATLLEAVEEGQWPQAGPLLQRLTVSKFARIADSASYLQETLELEPSSAASGRRRWPADSQPETLLFVPSVDRSALLRALGKCLFIRWNPDTEGAQLAELCLRSSDGNTSIRVILDGVARGQVVCLSGGSRKVFHERLRRARLSPWTRQEIDEQLARSEESSRAEWLIRQRSLERIEIR